jgi:hypothetical protein
MFKVIIQLIEQKNIENIHQMISFLSYSVETGFLIYSKMDLNIFLKNF